jgi:hypothetical protein
MGYWGVGIMEYWSVGVKEYWNVGVRYWGIGVLQYWKGYTMLSIRHHAHDFLKSLSRG